MYDQATPDQVLEFRATEISRAGICIAVIVLGIFASVMADENESADSERDQGGQMVIMVRMSFVMHQTKKSVSSMCIPKWKNMRDYRILKFLKGFVICSLLCTTTRGRSYE